MTKVKSVIACIGSEIVYADGEYRIVRKIAFFGDDGNTSGTPGFRLYPEVRGATNAMGDTAWVPCEFRNLLFPNDTPDYNNLNRVARVIHAVRDGIQRFEAIEVKYREGAVKLVEVKKSDNEIDMDWRAWQCGCKSEYLADRVDV